MAVLQVEFRIIRLNWSGQTEISLRYDRGYRPAFKKFGELRPVTQNAMISF
jgi:hypothetical protein